MLCNTVNMMNDYNSRVQTFKENGWPHKFLSPETMAKCGFYYLKRGDEVRCHFCKVEIMKWQPGDNPIADHKKYAPQCTFAQKILNLPFCDNDFKTLTEEQQQKNEKQHLNTLLYEKQQQLQQEQSQDECGLNVSVNQNCNVSNTPVHQQYTNYTTRLESFVNWSSSVSHKHLAEAGFFYVGDRDITVCFWCNVRLHQWCSGDDVWAEHARYFPSCGFVINTKGINFVQLVLSDECVIKSAAVNDNTNNDNGGSTNTAIICKICFDRNCNVCFTPCGHVFACNECAYSLNNCPLCRAKASVMRLFFC
ncbi:iap-3 [Psilogramma increta granulovirus]|uniref:Iap-3 n=1 Tax=Psilogramma increta granulovirus TaxID=2953508 RepID=A0A977XV14_9BBAC|nr:iap-3 [Psilogramma increta granulovirus]